MPAIAETPKPLSRRRALTVTFGALTAASLIFVAGVLPAEFNRDPTGLGRLLGTAKLWAPDEEVIAPAGANGSAAVPDARSYSTPFRSDVIQIPLKAVTDEEGGYELEYKVHLRKGASYVYSWSVPGIDKPEQFYTEFHGHTVIEGKSMTVAEYRKAIGTSDNGLLTAPFDGVHGWYFQNQSMKPVVVTLRLAGFYDLIPDGQPGNEAGLHATRIE